MGRTEGSTTIPLAVKRLIYFSAIDSDEPRETLATRLEYTIEKEGFRVPSHDNIEREISKARNSKSSDLDEPWSLFDATAKHPIPPEALPTILRVWGETMQDNKPLTIRQAQWVGRLYYVFKGAGEGALDAIPIITSIVRNYASFEKVAELAPLTGKPKEDIGWLRWFRTCMLYLSIGGMEIEEKRGVNHER